jgi:hypothetical protein
MAEVSLVLQRVTIIVRLINHQRGINQRNFFYLPSIISYSSSAISCPWGLSSFEMKEIKKTN